MIRRGLALSPSTEPQPRDLRLPRRLPFSASSGAADPDAPEPAEQGDTSKVAVDVLRKHKTADIVCSSAAAGASGPKRLVTCARTKDRR